jgi:hypothetical protein
MGAERQRYAKSSRFARRLVHLWVPSGNDPRRRRFAAEAAHAGQFRHARQTGRPDGYFVTESAPARRSLLRARLSMGPMLFSGTSTAMLISR